MFIPVWKPRAHPTGGASVTTSSEGGWRTASPLLHPSPPDTPLGSTREDESVQDLSSPLPGRRDECNSRVRGTLPGLEQAAAVYAECNAVPLTLTAEQRGECTE